MKADISQTEQNEFSEQISLSEERYVQARLIAFLYENILLQVIISPVLAFFVVWVFKDIQTPLILAIWFTSVCIAFFLRYLLYRAYLSANPSAEDAHIWGQRYALLMITAGSVWGVAGYFFYSAEHLPETMMLVIILAGLTAASFISHSAYLLAYITFPLFAVVPLSIRFYIEAGDVNIILGTLCLVYIFVLFSYASRAHKYLKQAVLNELQMKKLNEDLAIQKEKAEYANIAKSKFLAVASHDLRQPLHAIQLFTSALEMKSSEPSIKPIITNLTNATESLSHLFNNLLDLSMIEAKVINPAYTVFQLNDLLKKLQDEYEPKAWAKDIDFRFVQTSAIIWSDPLLVERITRNLLENAIRYTNSGAILIGCRRKVDHIRLDIWDTGIGISNEDIENIFNEFYQVDNPAQDKDLGLGLGLSIVNSLSKLINVDVGLSSQVGMGTRFSITLPLASYQQKLETGSKVNDIISSTNNLTGKVVVLVDDDKLIREAMRLLLEHWGCVSIIAEDMKSASTQVEVHHIMPDLIISDYRLKDNELGTDVILQFRSRYKTDIPAIIITGDTAPARLKKINDCNASLMHKPISPAKLRLLIEIVLNGEQ